MFSGVAIDGRHVRAILRRPQLWAPAATMLFRLAPTGWWKHSPHLPRPDARYMRFRMETAYGDGSAVPAVADLVSYLDWCRRQPKAG